MRKEFNSQRTGLGHQHGRRFIVLGHQYGRRDVMWKHFINVLYLHHNVEIPETKRFYCQGGWIGYNIELTELVYSQTKKTHSPITLFLSV